MAWTTQKWLNLRSTAGYVTDGSGQSPVFDISVPNALPVYPTSVTIDGDTFNVGWDSFSDGARNRANTLDPRIAGTHFIPNSAGSPRIFRIDLLGGSGTYEIRMASGDPEGFGGTNPHIKIYDDTTLKNTISGTGGIVNFMDSSGSDYSAAAWPGSNSALTVAFSSTTAPGSNPKLLIYCGDTATAGNTALNAVGIIKLGGGSAAASKVNFYNLQILN